MSSIWSRLYDSAKDRRYGALFFASILGYVLLSLFLCALAKILIHEAGDGSRIQVEALVGILGVVFVALTARAALHLRKAQKRRLRFPPMSSDELRAARSKLRKAGDRSRT